MYSFPNLKLVHFSLFLTIYQINFDASKEEMERFVDSLVKKPFQNFLEHFEQCRKRKR